MKRQELSCLLRNLSDGDKEGVINTLRRASASEQQAGRHEWAVQLEGYAQRIERKSQYEPKMLTLLTPSGKTHASMEAFQLRVPIRGIADIILPAEVKTEVDEVIRANKEREKLESHGLNPPNRLLLTGAPGTGKTMLAEVIAKETNREFFILKLGTLVNSYLGNTIKNIEASFAAIAQHDAVFLFDEFDALGTSRSGKDSDVNEMRRALNTLLVCFESHQGTSTIIAATNRPDVIDTAFRRRFDCVWKLGEPDSHNRQQVIRQTLLKHNMAQDEETIASLATSFDGLSFDECEDITRKLIVRAVLAGKSRIEATLNETARAEVGGTKP